MGESYFREEKQPSLSGVKEHGCLRIKGRYGEGKAWVETQLGREGVRPWVKGHDSGDEASFFFPFFRNYF